MLLLLHVSLLSWSGLCHIPNLGEAQAQIPISPRQCFLLQIQYSDEDIRYQKPKVQCISICSWYHNILDLRLSFFIYVYLLTFEFLYLCVCVLVYLCTVWWRGIPSTQLQVISWKLQLVIGFGGERGHQQPIWGPIVSIWWWGWWGWWGWWWGGWG